MMNVNVLPLKKLLLLGMCVCAGVMPALADETATDTTVVVPATGHLAVKVSSNFTASANMKVTSINATAKSTELKYNTAGGDSVFQSGVVILTAAPGEYVLTYTDATVTAPFYSSVLSWLDETPGVAYKKNRMLYRFVNNADSVGFVRDETYAESNYMSCALAEGDHLYLPLNTTFMSNLATTMGTTVAELSYIPWNGPVASDLAIEGVSADECGLTGASANSQRYNLLGQPVDASYRGLVIVNGKKRLVK